MCIKLYFYSYDKDSNTYNQIKTDYHIDANGYLCFSTSVGGDIVISDEPIPRENT